MNEILRENMLEFASGEDHRAARSEMICYQKYKDGSCYFGLRRTGIVTESGGDIPLGKLPADAAQDIADGIKIIDYIKEVLENDQRRAD